MTRPLITLLSDFGPGIFVGVMKGVMLGICPQARFIDLEHGIPAQDVTAAALCLEQVLGFFPKGAVHLVVVDPGVGTQRAALAIGAGGQFFVGPDNGLFQPVYDRWPDFRAHRIENPALCLADISATFHGRDIFAPVAAHLAAGLELEEVGPPLGEPVRLAWPMVQKTACGLAGRIIGRDGFGNLISNIKAADLSGRQVREVIFGDLNIRGLSPSYGFRPELEPLALLNSGGRLELALNRGNLAEHVSRGGKAPQEMNLRVILA